MYVLHRTLQHEQLVPQVLKLGPRDDQLSLIQPVRPRPLTCLKVTLTAASLAELTWSARLADWGQQSPAPTTHRYFRHSDESIGFG